MGLFYKTNGPHPLDDSSPQKKEKKSVMTT